MERVIIERLEAFANFEYVAFWVGDWKLPCRWPGMNEVEVVLKAGIIRRVSEGGVYFDVVSKKLSEDGVVKWVSDVIYEEDEKNWTKDTALWNATGNWIRIREMVANSDKLGVVSEERLDPV